MGEAKLTDSQKEIIDHIIYDISIIFLDSKLKWSEVENHNVREMVWREIFFRTDLGDENIEISDALFGEFFLKVLPDKELNKYWNLEKYLKDLSGKQAQLYRESEETSKKITEMVQEREKKISEGNENYKQAAEYQPKNNEITEEEEKLEKEWADLGLGNSGSLNKEKLEELIKKQQDLNTQREEFNNIFSQFLKKEEDIKKEIASYSKQLDKYHTHWNKLNKELIEISHKVNELKRVIIEYQNQKFVELLKKLG